jgi:hypothetical protein
MERPGATTLRGNPLTVLGPALKPGDKAPDFKAVDDSLKDVSLAGTGSGIRSTLRFATRRPNDSTKRPASCPM